MHEYSTQQTEAVNKHKQNLNVIECNHTFAYSELTEHKEIHIDTDFLDCAEATILEDSLRHSDIKYLIDSYPTTFGPIGMSYNCYIKVIMSFPSNLIKKVFRFMDTEYRYAITLNEYQKNECVSNTLFNNCYVYDIKVFNEYENMSDIEVTFNLSWVDIATRKVVYERIYNTAN